MPQSIYLPEGQLLYTPENQRLTESREGLEQAWRQGTVLEGIATLCDENRSLYVRFGNERGRIPREEAGLGAETGKMKEIAILSRVGKPVCFRIIGREGEEWLLSRRAAQEEAQDFFQRELLPGEVIRVTVTHLEQFGAFVDMGRGLVSMIGIENISVSRIRHPEERFTVGQQLLAVVLCKEPGGRICLTHRELLGTWSENADHLRPGQAVRGIIRGVEPYGVFIEIFPNLSGLAEPCATAVRGMTASVYIKSILPDRMKIKLTLLDKTPGEGKRLISPEDYYIREGRIRCWRYQPECCARHCIETDFC